MLRQPKTLSGYQLESLEGEIGNVEEFYFDDRHWTIRYLVADTGNCLTGQQVLIIELQLWSSINQFFERLEHGKVASRLVLEFARA